MIAVDEKEEEEGGNLTFYSAMLGMKSKNTTIPTFPALTSKSTFFYWQILDPWLAWYWYGTSYYISTMETQTVCNGQIRSQISSNR